MHTAISLFGLVVCLLFFDSAVVVHEYKGILILRVDVALSALVARAEVARGIIRR